MNPPPTAFTPLYFPVLNIPASDIRIRPEFTALFDLVNISASHLITHDDLPPFDVIEKILKPANTRWILVDHNKLQEELHSIYSARVHGAIDHHQEEHAVPRETDPEPRLIEKCGSCTSLVLRTFLSSWDDITSISLASGAGHAQGDLLVDDQPFRQTWDAQVAKMALASILIDTANLTDEEKVEVADCRAVVNLETRIQHSPKDAESWDRTQFYKEIDQAKKNIGGLNLDELLRKDFKEWTENGVKLGISSVLRLLPFLASEAQGQNPRLGETGAVDKSVTDFMASRSLSLFAIMAHSKSENNQLRREIFLHANSPKSFEAVSKFWERSASELGLEDLVVAGMPPKNNPSGSETESPVMRRVWLQKNVSKSRKQVAPLIRAAMR